MSKAQAYTRKLIAQRTPPKGMTVQQEMQWNREQANHMQAERHARCEAIRQDRQG